MSTPRRVQPLCLPSDATLELPGSKSEANRLLVAAALTGRVITIHGASASDDVRHLVAGLNTLGFAAQFVDAGTVRVGPRRTNPPTSGELFCGNAGTALRFLISVAAITRGDWIVTGDARMQTRPIQPLVDAWRQLGIDMEATDGCAPVRVRGGSPCSDRVTIDPTLSSQFVSSLLLVGAQLANGLAIDFTGKLASRSYAQLTCSMLARVGVQARIDEHSAQVTPRPSHAPVETGCKSEPTSAALMVSGDWSSMGIFTCLNHLSDSRVRASNLATNSGQADEQLHATLAQLNGDGERTLDVTAIPDQFLNLAIVAALRLGTTTLTGAANVRVKECDRIAVMARELRKLGVDLDEQPDGLIIRGGQAMQAATIDPEDDHRVAMAFALAGLLVDGITIDNPDCVTKSYPMFWRDLDRVRQQHRAIAIIGMRGAGKTTFGQALAKRIDSAFVDTDEVFAGQHGAIADFVAAHGWPAFRAYEERIVREAMIAGHVIATGGGAIESEATRALLTQQAFTIWLSADADLLRTRLGHGRHRPSLTGAPVTAEIATVLAKRDPIYRNLADRTVPAGQTTAEQVAAVLAPTS